MWRAVARPRAASVPVRIGSQVSACIAVALYCGSITVSWAPLYLPSKRKWASEICVTVGFIIQTTGKSERNHSSLVPPTWAKPRVSVAPMLRSPISAQLSAKSPPAFIWNLKRPTVLAPWSKFGPRSW